MKREIKFRAWNPESKIMTGWSFLKDAELPLPPKYPQFILMQYIGAVDKNGTYIFEGDIIGEFGDPNCFIIVWDEKYCSFGASLQNNKKSGIVNEINDDWMKEIEVLGNIYENPMLCVS